ncbi:flagellar hook assembly protein FlgD [Roseateles toxinivorans]|uniref:Basal-body rod modification protein FlgD n=1 Tax=Roseateles toxinivorans TaxID=270368 RepID=A0A4R6QNS1_9BURK|nr:flagellar hook capping FlgD N-terminal domain-containing protein [Roseateles toxinivorans]TDP71655.1 flagellar basal-body rod modification protein FlgD [Roseateles toxinivorans]
MAVGTVGDTSTDFSSTPKLTKNQADTQDRFLKLLVTQMQNQDPMNPMDNAQVTSQMAQIQTVSGIETLNGSVQSLTSQFANMQALQSVAMVGHNVLIPGDRLAINEGKGVGAYELDATARAVKLEVLNAAGVVLDTQQLGDQTAGRHSFSVDASKYADQSGLKFRITATTSTGTVGSTTLAQDKVMAISTSDNKLQLELQNAGLVYYSSVKSFN